jgi:hypothetical protein
MADWLTSVPSCAMPILSAPSPKLRRAQHFHDHLVRPGRQRHVFCAKGKLRNLRVVDHGLAVDASAGTWPWFSTNTTKLPRRGKIVARPAVETRRPAHIHEGGNLVGGNAIDHRPPYQGLSSTFWPVLAVISVLRSNGLPLNFRVVEGLDRQPGTNLSGARLKPERMASTDSLGNAAVVENVGIYRPRRSLMPLRALTSEKSGNLAAAAGGRNRRERRPVR